MERNLKQQNIIPNPRINIPIRNYYPERTINSALTHELFLKISESDLSKLKDFIITNNITLYVKDENKNSVLHYAIKNVNLTKNEKLELINFLIERGAPIVSYNNENITPLHLAAKYQLEEVINILISKGADPNVYDNQMMTPLHYAVQGHNIECKSVRKIKVNNLINNNTIVSNSKVYQLETNLIDYIYPNDHLGKYLTHMKNTINNYHNMYAYEFDKIKVNFNNELNNLLSNTTINKNNLDQTIKTKISNITENINKSLLNKLDETLKPLDIKLNQKSGPYNILPFVSVKTFNNELHTNNTKTFAKFTMNINTHALQIKEIFNKLLSIADLSYTTIRNLYWYNAGFYINTNDSRNNLAYVMKDIISISPVKLLYFDVALDIYNETTINNNTTDYNLIDLTSTNNFSWDRINNQLVDLLKIDNNFYNYPPPTVKRGKVNEVNKSKTYYTETNITDDRDPNNLDVILPNTIGRRPDLTDSVFIEISNKVNNIIQYLPIPHLYPPINQMINVNTNTNTTYGYIDYDYTFISKFKYYILRIKKYLEFIEINNANLLIASIDYMLLIILINITYILNCLIILKLIEDEIEINIKTKINYLENMFNMKMNEQHLQNFSHIFYLDIAKHECTKLYNEYKNINIIIIFRQLVVYLNEYNTLIDYINGVSLYKHTLIYNNNFVANMINLQNTLEYTGLFENVLDKINISELDYDTFVNLLNNNNITTLTTSNYIKPNIVNNIKKVKKILIEKYILKIYNLNKNNFCYDSHPVNPQISRLYSLEYVYNNINNTSLDIQIINNINALHIVSDNNLNINYKITSLAYQFAYKDFNQPLPEAPLQYINGYMFNTSSYLDVNHPNRVNHFINNNNDIFDDLNLIDDNRPKSLDGNISTSGIYGFIIKHQQSKQNIALPIISYNINLHFKIIKYILLQTIIVRMNNLLVRPPVPPLSPFIQQIITTMTDYNNYIKTYINTQHNDYSIIIMIIAKLVDNILNKFIREKIYMASINATNILLNNINVPQNITDIINRINANVNLKELIPYNDTGFKLNLNEIVDGVISGFMKPNLPPNIINNSYQLNFTSLILEESELDNKNINTLYNYSLNSQKIIKQCYSINENVVNKLITITQLNKKDFAGNTPLYYAIETQNIDIIKMLIKYNASVNQIKNNIGLTPLDFAKNIYNAHVSLLNQSNNLITSLTDTLYIKIKEIILQNPLFKNNILKYSNLFLPLILILINHHFFIYTKKYPKEWTFEKMKKLSNIITGSENALINPNLPILDMNDDVKKIGISGTGVLIDNKKIIELQIKQHKDKINDLTNTNTNLLLELDTIRYSLNQTEINRVNEINNIIAKNNIDLTDLRNSLNNFETNLTNLINNKNIIETQNISTNITKIRNSNRLLDNGNVIDVYESIFWKILNSNNVKTYLVNIDFKSYPSLMKNYIYSKQINNIYVLHPFLQSYVHNLLNDKSKKIDLNMIDNINIISDLYKSVFYQVAKDYEELPLEYNDSNYILKQVIDIITHCFKHTLITSLYHSIIKTITKYITTIYKNSTLTNRFASSSYSIFLNETIEQILYNNKPESELLKYIFNLLPLRLIKITLNIYDTENDPDKIYNIDSLYEEIINILLSNKVIQITNDSSLIENIKNYLIPYFKDYNTLFINESYNLVNGYFGYILSESKLLNIISLLLTQSIKENNKK